MKLICAATLVAIAAAGCGDSTAAGGGGGAGGGSGGGPAETPDFTAGGDRPVTVMVPPGYDPSVPTPLVILLHGYGAQGVLEDFFLKMSDGAAERGVIFAAPNGTPDTLGRPFWNATDACCNFDDIDVDDDAYLMGLVDEIESKLNVDPDRVYFAGHSNGGFMSHRLACDFPDRIAAIAVLAGAMHVDPADCGATQPVTVLQIHGTADDTIHYEGGDLFGNPYPSVEQTLQTWIDIDGCNPDAIAGGTLDLDVDLAGAETEVSTYEGCDQGTIVELWAIQGGGHVPSFDYTIGTQMIDFLLAHPKQN